MDGGGDNQQAVRFFRIQEQRQRLLAHRQRRAALAAGADALDPVAHPTAVPVPGSRAGAAHHRRRAASTAVEDMRFHGFLMSDLAEDSGFESGSEGE